MALAALFAARFSAHNHTTTFSKLRSSKCQAHGVNDSRLCLARAAPTMSAMNAERCALRAMPAHEMRRGVTQHYAAHPSSITEVGGAACKPAAGKCNVVECILDHRHRPAHVRWGYIVATKLWSVTAAGSCVQLSLVNVPDTDRRTDVTHSRAH